MRPHSNRARANLELILAEVEELCKGVVIPRTEKRGRPPQYGDAFILQLVVLQYLLGFTSERSFLRFLPNLKRQEFARLPDQSQYNRRAKHIRPLIKPLDRKILKRLKVSKSSMRIVDNTPVPLLRLSRVKRRRVFLNKNEAAIGYCASQKTYYFGCKLSLVINRDGVPFTFQLFPANKGELPCLEATILSRNIRMVTIIGDKGFISYFNKHWLQHTRGIVLVTPYRKNQKRHNTKRERQLLKGRRLIETVIGQLKDQFGLRGLRVRNRESLESRVENMLFTYLFGVYFNKKYHRNPLRLKSILV